MCYNFIKIRMYSFIFLLIILCLLFVITKVFHVEIYIYNTYIYNTLKITRQHPNLLYTVRDNPRDFTLSGHAFLINFVGTSRKVKDRIDFRSYTSAMPEIRFFFSLGLLTLLMIARIKHCAFYTRSLIQTGLICRLSP